jgi:YbbR domain-containing protein
MMDRLLENDTVLKILSLLVAIAVWVSVNNPRFSPQFVRRPIKNVPVATSAPNRNLTVVSVKPSRVTVTIQGPASSNLGTVRNAWVQLANITRPGIYALKVEAAVPTGTKPVRVQPAEVLVNVEQIVNRRYPVSLVPVGAPPGGYGVVSLGGGRTYEATVSGASGLVDEVKEVVGKITIVGEQSSFFARVILSAVNQKGTPVANVQVTPEILTVPVTILPEKTVPIVVRYIGKPTAGFSVTGISVNPNSVTLAGPSSELSTISAVDTDAVDISGASHGVTVTKHLALPRGVQVVGRDTVSVTISIGS